MQIDTELDYKLAARFNFRMRRTAEIQKPAPVPAPVAPLRRKMKSACHVATALLMVPQCWRAVGERTTA